MLKLKNIKKTYVSGDEKVEALKGINIEFRKSEFVSILGQSGCGKTTLLNIIGGLDRYTSGDLIINGKSTKDFKDRDWDAYRNYSVGFVFQSYNLIGHQTVLSNVELALTISGVSRKERKQRAIKALEEVGLKEQIHKRPNQLSGGQMQRVAIARALVNNPDIILADEPTGALDTKTSVQVMEILKKISKDKLIIMVTHNPELAEKYSSRIIKILDGKITDDSDPIEHQKEEKKEDTKKRRTSMKFLTALRLSLNNLMTKKGRTILTSFAGSIGIIGIALILAISTGVQNYINKVEEDTLSSYPITIEESTVDMSSLMQSMSGENTDNTENKEEGKAYSADIMNDMITTLSNKKQSNNLKELKKYLDDGNNEITKNSNSIKYGYDLNINLYRANTDNGIVRVNPSTVMNAFGMGDMIEAQNNSAMSSVFGSSMMTNTDVCFEMLDNQQLLESQYDLIKGNWPKQYNEVVLVLKEDGRIDDYTLYSLGLKDQSKLKDKWKAVENGEKLDENQESTSYSYDDLLNLQFKLLLNSDYYQKQNGLWINKEDNDNYLKEKINNAETIKIVGIIIAIVIIGVLILKISVTKKYDGKEVKLITKEDITLYLTDIKYDEEQGPQLYFRFDKNENDTTNYSIEVTTRYINGVRLYSYEKIGVQDTASINLYSFYKRDLDALNLKTNKEKLNKYGYTVQDYKNGFSNINSFDLEIKLYKWVYDDEKKQSNEMIDVQDRATIDIVRGHEVKIGSLYKIIKVNGNENNLLKKIYKVKMS